MADLQIGDHIVAVAKGGINTHHGLYVGDGMVVHYDGWMTESPETRLVKTTLGSFAAGERIEILSYDDSARTVAREESAARADSLVGQDLSGTLGKDPKTFVVWCITNSIETDTANKDTAAVVGLSGAGNVVVSAAASKALQALIGSKALPTSRALTAMVTVGSTSSAAATSTLSATLLADSPALSSEERDARKTAREASVLGGSVGTAATIGAIGVMGSAGLTSAGIASGLTAIGATVGGGLATGSMIAVATPAVAATAAGLGVYRAIRWLRERNSVKNGEGEEIGTSSADTIADQSNIVDASVEEVKQ